jgi:uncharacterized membrane protein
LSGFLFFLNRAILVPVKQIEVAIMDVFFGYNPYVMITIYALLLDGVFHALRARKRNSKPIKRDHSIAPVNYKYKFYRYNDPTSFHYEGD